jgi:hypothetical protein
VVRDEKEKDRWYLQLERYNMTAQRCYFIYSEEPRFLILDRREQSSISAVELYIQYSEEPRFLIFDSREQSSVALVPWKTLVDMGRDMG